MTSILTAWWAALLQIISTVISQPRPAQCHLGLFWPGVVMEILYFRPNITPTGLLLGSNLTEDNPSSFVSKKAISWLIQTKVHHKLKTQAAPPSRLHRTMALSLQQEHLSQGPQRHMHTCTLTNTPFMWILSHIVIIYKSWSQDICSYNRKISIKLAIKWWENS